MRWELEERITAPASRPALWELEERITAPASRRALCRQVNFPAVNTVFLSHDYFFTIDLLYFFSFGVNMDKKKVVKKLQIAKSVKDIGSSLILTCMAALFASSSRHLTDLVLPGLSHNYKQHCH